MNPLQEKSIQCPYCWENIVVVVDCSIDVQEYIEDCQVCCQPIVFNVNAVSDEEFNVQAAREND